MCGFIKCSKSKNELEREYLEVEKQDANYGPQIFSLTCNKKSTRNVFRKRNKSSKVRLIYLEVLKHAQSCGWRFRKKTKRKKVQAALFEVKHQQKIFAWCIYRFNCLKKGVAENGTNNLLQVKQAISKVLLYF